MSETLKKDNFYSLVLFFISPLMSVIVASRSYSSPWAKNMVWLFVIFYAISFSIPSENSDAYFYKEQLETFHYSAIKFTDFVSNFYSVKPNPSFDKSFDDLIQPVLSYGVSLFTDNYKVLYLLVGIIFGYFFSRNIWFLMESIRGKVQLVHVLILLSFALVIPFWQLNSIRMWTAAHIFFYGAVHYLYKGNKKSGLIFVLISALMHFSFLLPVCAFLLYLLLGNRNTIYFYLFVFSFFVNEIDLGALRAVLVSVLPDFFHRRVETYTPGEIITHVDVKSWHAVYYGLVLKWVVFFCITTLYIFCRKRIEKYPELLRIFSFTLLILAIGQFSSLVPSGGRFLKVGYLFAFMSLFYSVQYFKDFKIIKNSFYLITPGLLFYCIIALRVGFDSINLGILGNMVTLAIFGDIDTRIIDLIK
jgi:hypothetical protein